MQLGTIATSYTVHTRELMPAAERILATLCLDHLQTGSSEWTWDPAELQYAARCGLRHTRRLVAQLRSTGLFEIHVYNDGRARMRLTASGKAALTPNQPALRASAAPASTQTPIASPPPPQAPRTVDDKALEAALHALGAAFGSPGALQEWVQHALRFGDSRGYPSTLEARHRETLEAFIATNAAPAKPAGQGRGPVPVAAAITTAPATSPSASRKPNTRPLSDAILWRDLLRRGYAPDAETTRRRHAALLFMLHEAKVFRAPAGSAARLNVIRALLHRGELRMPRGLDDQALSRYVRRSYDLAA